MKRLLMISLAVLAASPVVAPAPAHACSADWTPGWSPKEIMRRADVRKLEGRFIVERVERRDGGVDGYIHGVVYGHVVAKNGKTYATIQIFTEPQISCERNTKPLLDAEGKYYVTRRKTDGRHELLLWEGRYLADEPEFVIPPLDAEEGP